MLAHLKKGDRLWTIANLALLFFFRQSALYSPCHLVGCRRWLLTSPFFLLRSFFSLHFFCPSSHPPYHSHPSPQPPLERLSSFKIQKKRFRLLTLSSPMSIPTLVYSVFPTASISILGNNRKLGKNPWIRKCFFLAKKNWIVATNASH